jgi:ureidoacrylate peracid hydrolase
VSGLPVVPARMALVFTDIQNVFVEGFAPDGLVVLERIKRLARVCREAGIAVFHLRQTIPAGLDGGGLGIVNNGFLERDSTTASFHKDLVRVSADNFSEKPHYGGFLDTNLELLLRRRGVDTIIITGIETNVCCETIAREAMERNFRVFFISDGITTEGGEVLTGEEVQRASRDTLGNNFAQVLTVDEMIQKIKDVVATG